MTVSTMTCEGLTIDDFKAFYNPETFHANIKIVDPILTCKRLPTYDDEDVRIMYQHIKTPFIVSNRCAFMAIYSIELPNGDIIHMTTSKGNQSIVDANQDL